MSLADAEEIIANAKAGPWFSAALFTVSKQIDWSLLQLGCFLFSTNRILWLVLIFYYSHATFPALHNEEEFDISIMNIDDQPTSQPGEFQTVISQQSVIRSTSCLFLGYGNRGRRIQRRYFRSDQNQDGSLPPCWKNVKWPLSGGSSDPLHV